MSKSPKYHPTAVSAALRKAGLRKSEFLRSGQVRGWGSSTSGFKIVTDYGTTDRYVRARSWRHDQRMVLVPSTDRTKVKAIRVEWRCGDWFRGDHVAEEHKNLVEVTAALVAKGYKAELTSRPASFGGGVNEFVRIDNLTEDQND